MDSLDLRIQKEMKAWERLKEDLDAPLRKEQRGLKRYCHIRVMPQAHDLRVLIVFLPAFSDMSEMKYLKLQIEIPDDYPDHAPTFKFLTPLWHPNISLKDGKVLPELNPQDWNMFGNLPNIILALYTLLDYPDMMEHITEREVSQQFFMDRHSYLTASTAWRKTFACSIPEEEGDIFKLHLMMEKLDDARCPIVRKVLVQALAKIKRITIRQQSEAVKLVDLITKFSNFRPRVHRSHLLGESGQKDAKALLAEVKFGVIIDRDDLRSYYYSSGHYVPMGDRAC